jgi:copper chaperone
MTTLRINGMKCQHCVATAKKVLEQLGAISVTIDLDRGEARFDGTPDQDQVRRAMAAKGFTVVE